MKFSTSLKKIKWANQHIVNIHSMLLAFGRLPDSYTLWIDNDAETGQNFLCVDFRDDLFPRDEIALTVGDALHNLRSALDLMYYQIVLSCEGEPSDFTRFPIFEKREKVESWLNSALKKRQITPEVFFLILDTIKPYTTGNPLLFALREMNDRDKHKLFIPVLESVMLLEVSIEDDQGRNVGATGYYTDDSFRVRLMDANDRKVAVKNKGHASPTIVFGPDSPFNHQPVIISLSRIAVEVTRTVDAFESLEESCFT
jgi:hypothetical protein